MMDLVVRTSAKPAPMAEVVRREIQAVDRSVAKFRIFTATQELGEQTGERRFDTLLVSTFALAALLLSAIGVYVLLHHSVVQRKGEIGIRMALGATPGSVMGLFLRRGFQLALCGAAAGVAGAWAACRVLSKLLYEIAPTDTVTFAIAVLLLIGVAGLACWMPSRSAARIDPILALRQD